MRRELDEQLCSRYPEIFQDRHGDLRRTAMCWGFDCGNGWFNLLDVLCSEITRHVEASQASDEPLQLPTAVQVKEKFGRLCFYTDFCSDDVVDGLIWMAEALSGRLCEECGAPAQATSGTWIKVRCESHMTPKELESLRKQELRLVDPNEPPYEPPPPSTILEMPHSHRPGWLHLVKSVGHTVWFDMEHNSMPQVWVDQVIEHPDRLEFRWRGGNDRARGMFMLVEACSFRVDPKTGQIRPHAE